MSRSPYCCTSNLISSSAVTDASLLQARFQALNPTDQPSLPSVEAGSHEDQPEKSSRNVRVQEHKDTGRAPLKDRLHTCSSMSAARLSNAQHQRRAKRRPLHAVVRPLPNTNAIDIHLRAYRFFRPTPGTAAT